MTFAQQPNHLTTHFSERIPDVKRRICIYIIIIIIYSKIINGVIFVVNVDNTHP